MLSTLWLPHRLASGFSSSGGGLGTVLFFGGQPDWWLSGHSFWDRKGHSGDFEGGCHQMNLPPGRLHPPLVVGDLAIPWESCGIHSPTAWVPSRWPPSDWLGFGPSEGTTLLIHWILTSPANRPGLHKLAPRSQNKSDAFAAEGCCLWCAFIRRTFLVTCWHFLFAWKLAGEQEYVCNVHLSKMSPFWLKWAWSEWSVWKNPPTTPRVGHGSWTTCETSEGDSRKPQRGCGQVAQISPSLTDLQADPMDCPGSDGQGRLHYDGRPCLSVDIGRFGTDTESDWLEVQRWWKRVWSAGIKLHSDEDVPGGDAGQEHVPSRHGHRNGHSRAGGEFALQPGRIVWQGGLGERLDQPDWNPQATPWVSGEWRLFEETVQVLLQGGDWVLRTQAHRVGIAGGGGTPHKEPQEIHGRWLWEGRGGRGTSKPTDSSTVGEDAHGLP